MKRLALAAALAALPAIAFAAPGFAPLEVTAAPIERFEIAPGATDDGEIVFRGGLALDSSNRLFGGLSGLDIAADGRFYAVSDTGFWLTGHLVEDGDNWLRGATDWQIAPILDADGDEANRTISADAEGLRLDSATGTLLVSFEHNHRVGRFAVDDLASARPVAVTLPTLTGLGGNRGIEAVALAPMNSPLAGAVVIVSEQADDGTGNIRAWIVDGPLAGAFSVVRSDQFAVTDAAFLPNGDLLILERRLTLGAGIGMRIRRLPAADIRPGAVVDGPTVLTDDHIAQIDNMEGMAVRQLPSGEVLITLVSDDNFSLLQRTLLLQFLWQPAME